MKSVFVEKDGRLTVEPEAKLWEMPNDFPADLEAELGGEEDVKEIFEKLFGPDPIEGWTMDHARAMVNNGRRQMYEKFKQGLLPPV